LDDSSQELADETYSPLRIALAEDEPITLQCLEEILVDLGHRVVVKAGNGRDLVSGCLKEEPDLVITDIKMPLMDGIEAMRAIYGWRPIPVIMISGYYDPNLVERATREFLLSYLVKPIKPTDIEPAIVTAQRRFADMERLRRERAVEAIARAESLRIVAAGIAHRFNNHLCSILGNTELLEPLVASNAHAASLLRAIAKSGEQAAAIARAMHDYTGSNIRESKPVSIAEIVEKSKLLIDAIVPEGITVEYELHDHEIKIDGDHRQLQQILLAFVENSVEAIKDKPGRISISSRVATVTKKELSEVVAGSATLGCPYLQLAVADNGCGMDEATISRMLDPFFSTKFLGRGLGLSAAAGIIGSHGGSLLVQSGQDQGTVMRVCFPQKRVPNSDALKRDGQHA
jgi:signal transduction histidine kinase